MSTANLSEAQLAANRANAQKSTGPKSPAGKQRSSQNARRHGLALADAVLPQEEAADWAQFHAETCAYYEPRMAVEHELCQQLADTRQLIRRLQRQQTGLQARQELPAGLTHNEATQHLASLCDDDRLQRQLERLSLQRAREERNFHRTLETLDRRRKGQARFFDPDRTPYVYDIAQSAGDAPRPRDPRQRPPQPEPAPVPEPVPTPEPETKQGQNDTNETR